MLRVPIPPALAAYLVGGAEFLLPIMLVLGFGTRFAALGLLVVTALIQLYVLPEALWTAHVYWASILLVLLSRGPGHGFVRSGHSFAGAAVSQGTGACGETGTDHRPGDRRGRR